MTVCFPESGSTALINFLSCYVNHSLAKSPSMVYTKGKTLKKGGAREMDNLLNIWGSAVAGLLSYWLLWAVGLPHWVCVVGAVGLVILSMRGRRATRKCWVSHSHF